MTVENPSNTQSQEVLNETQKDERLVKIEKEISELTDNDDINDKIENLDRVFTTEFAKNLNIEVAKQLLDKIKGKYSENWEILPEWLQDLIDFLEPIAYPYTIEWDLGWISDKDWEKWNYRNKEKQEKLQEGKTLILEKINEQIKKIDLINDDRLVNIKLMFENVKKAMDNLTEENTKNLQKYIYNNLDEESKSGFEKTNKNKKTWEFDGKFGESTLEWLDKILHNAVKYIDSVEKAKKVQEAADKELEKEKEEKKQQENEIPNKKQQINDVIDWLKLEKTDEKWLYDWDIYKKSGESGYYYVDNDQENLIYIPENLSNGAKSLQISAYKNWITERQDYSMDQYLKNLLQNSLSGVEIGKVWYDIIIENWEYKLVSFGVKNKIRKKTFEKWWLFKWEKQNLIKDLKMIHLANLLFNKFKWKMDWWKFEIKDNALTLGKKRYDLSVMVWEILDTEQSKIFCKYLNKYCKKPW